MKQGYCIRILPVSAIQYDTSYFPRATKLCRQYGRRMPLKIPGNVFPNIPLKLPIREKAYDFARRGKENCETTVYTVLYADEECMQCLFVFRFVKTTGACVIVRCVGKRCAKKHWTRIRQYIDKYGESIRNGIIDKRSCLEFY